MNCDEYRKQQILEEESLPADIGSHFVECVGCQLYLRDQERLRIVLRRIAESERAPEELQENIARLAGQPRARKLLRSRLWIAAAAAILVLVGTGGTLEWYHRTQMPTPERLAKEFVADHLHYLPSREQVVSGSAQQVEGWFQGRVEFSVRVPEIPGAVLQDARVCDISGRKAALLHYRRNQGDALVSLFVAEEPKAFEQLKQPLTVDTSSQGLNSTLWCHRGLVYGLVAALDESALRQIAQSVRTQSP